MQEIRGNSPVWISSFSYIILHYHSTIMGNFLHPTISNRQNSLRSMNYRRGSIVVRAHASRTGGLRFESDSMP